MDLTKSVPAQYIMKTHAQCATFDNIQKAFKIKFILLNLNTQIKLLCLGGFNLFHIFNGSKRLFAQITFKNKQLFPKNSNNIISLVL